MRVKVFSAAAVLAVVLIPAAASAGGPKPQPLPAAQAQALINAPAAVPSGSVTRAVSLQEALAAASLPGATVSVAPGLSLEQAVGLAPARSLSAVRRSAVTACAANADHITYTSSSATGSGTLCGVDWTSSQTVSGGVGYSWFVTRSRAGFS